MGKARTNVGQFQMGGFEQRIVLVKQVVPERMMALTIDDKNQQFAIPLSVLPSTYRIPRAGEWWYIQKTLGQWIFTNLAAETIHQYYQSHEVEVESIDGDEAIVHFTSDPTKKRTINLLIKRYKSYESPEVGETWIIDNALGEYTFAAFVGSIEPVVPIDSEPVEYEATSVSNMGDVADAFVAFSGHPWLLARVPASGKVFVEVGMNNAGNWNTDAASISIGAWITQWNAGPNEYHGYTREDADSDPSPGSGGATLVSTDLANSAYTQFPTNSAVGSSGTTIVYKKMYSGLPVGELLQFSGIGRISSGDSTSHNAGRPYIIVTPVPPFLMSGS